MIRAGLFVLVIATALAVPVITMKDQDYDQLSSSTKARHESQLQDIRVSQPDEVTPMEFSEIKPHKVQPHKSKAKSKKARARMAAAMERDNIMYGGQSFVPPAGHELYFDFESFGEFADAHSKMMSNAMSAVEEVEQTFDNSTGLTTKKFFTACIEINVCVNNAPGGVAKQMADAANTCGQIGLSVSAELETTQGGKKEQKLTITGAMQASVSFKAFGASLTIYMEGQIDWEFSIANGKYTNVYEAVWDGMKQFVQKASGKNTVPKAVLARAADARKQLVDLELKPDKTAMPVEGQQDELKGMVTIHYAILKDYRDALAVAGVTAATARKLLSWAIYKNVYNPSAAKLATAKTKATLDQMIKDDDFPCAKLIKKSTTKIRLTAAALGIDNALFCSVLKYGVLLKESERKVTKGFFWNNDGSSENSKNSVPVMYAELTPAADKDLQFIRSLLDQWFEQFSKVTNWNAPPKNVTETVNIPGNDGGVKTFVRSVVDVKIADTTESDPCSAARRLFQTLAMSAENLEKTLQGMGDFDNSENGQFALEQISITGAIGATFGGSRGGYCTNDSNQVQFKFSRTYTWAAATGFSSGSAEGNLWFAYSFGSFFQFQITIPLTTLNSWVKLSTAKKAQVGNYIVPAGGNADNPWSLRLHFSFPNGFIKGSDPPAISQTLIEGVGVKILDMVTQFYTEFKTVNTNKKASLMTKLSTTVDSLMTKYTAVKTQCKAAGVLKTDPPGATPKAIWVAALKAAGKAALQQAGSALLGLEFGSLTEIGIQGEISKAAKWTIAASIDLATTKFFKLDLGVVTLYYISGTSYEIKKSHVFP